MSRRASVPAALMVPFNKGKDELRHPGEGGVLPDGRQADIGITGRTIAAVGRIEAEAGRVVDATGCLVAPPFVDPHFHLDATLSYGTPRINASGTLLEGISLWGELRARRRSTRWSSARFPIVTGRNGQNEKRFKDADLHTNIAFKKCGGI